MSPNLLFNVKDSTEELNVRLEFDPFEYFYPHYGLMNREGKKIAKLFAGKKYKSIFEGKLSWSLPFYLWAIEKEAEIQCADKSLRSVETQIAEKDKTVYNLVRSLGPRALRMPSIFLVIEDWCIDGEFSKFNGLIKAIRQYRRETFNSGNYQDREVLRAIGFHYSTVHYSTRQLKKDITRAGREIESKARTEPERILREWEQRLRENTANPKLKRLDWYENLRRISKKAGLGEQPKNIVSCVRQNTPRWLAIMLLSIAFHTSWAVADRAIRHEKEIAKTWYK
jgi:hypothetical protein